MTVETLIGLLSQVDDFKIDVFIGRDEPREEWCPTAVDLYNKFGYRRVVIS